MPTTTKHLPNRIKAEYGEKAIYQTNILNAVESGQPTVAIAMAIADILDVKMTEIEPLYNYIDGDALGKLMATKNWCAREGIRVEFSTDEFDISLRSNGLLTISER